MNSDARPLFLVLSSRRGFEALVGPVPRSMRGRFRFEKSRKTKRIEALLPRCRLVVSKSYLRPETNRWIFRARRMGIPTLLLVDGPLEWSNLRSNPRLASLGEAVTGLYEPLVHDAVATIGETQQAWIGAQNADRSILVTTYANRRILTERREPAARDPSFDFLLTTARTPSFDARERDALHRAMHACATALDRAGHRLLLRMTDDALSRAVRDAAPSARLDSTARFADALARTRCVIGTPSSVLLEAMHHDKPTALLQFRTGPLFYECGWLLDLSAQTLPSGTPRSHAPNDWNESFHSMLARESEPMARQRASLRENCSTEDFFDLCERIARDDILEKPRSLDTLDLRFEAATLALLGVSAPGPAPKSC